MSSQKFNPARITSLSEIEQKIEQKFASDVHEEWRKEFDPEYKKTGIPSKKRIKDNKDGTSGDINVPFDKLHSDWKAENLASGKTAVEVVCAYGRILRTRPSSAAEEKYQNSAFESAAEYIHDEWMKRNPKNDWNEKQHIPYADLPDDEKLKDMRHVFEAIRLLNEVDAPMRTSEATDYPVENRFNFPKQLVNLNNYPS